MNAPIDKNAPVFPHAAPLKRRLVRPDDKPYESPWSGDNRIELIELADTIEELAHPERRGPAEEAPCE